GQVILGVIALLIGLGLLATHFFKGPQTKTLAPGLISLAVVLPIVVWGVVIVRKPVKEVQLYPSGLVWREPTGDWRGCRWEDVQEVYGTEVKVNGQWQTRQIYLRPFDEEGAALTHALDGWPKMADLIQMEVHKRQLPEAREAYDAGKAVNFGPVVLTQ